MDRIAKGVGAIPEDSWRGSRRGRHGKKEELTVLCIGVLCSMTNPRTEASPYIQGRESFMWPILPHSHWSRFHQPSATHHHYSAACWITFPCLMITPYHTIITTQYDMPLFLSDQGSHTWHATPDNIPRNGLFLMEDSSAIKKVSKQL